jgi:nucleoid-associated protein YgaU
MTTDAKIGLLLGLVFIVIIAFVINGLPSFQKNSSSNDLTHNYVTQVGKEPMGLPNSQSLEAINSDTNVISPQVAATDKSDAAKEHSSITQVNNPIETTLSINEQANATAVGSDSKEETLLPIDTTETQANNAVTQLDSEKSQAASEQKSAIYVVKKGDNLGLIAQNHYGTQGPKKENITKIVKANRLKSDRQIYIGQKLVIPSPTALVKAKPSMFEEVQNMGKQLTSPDPSAETGAANEGLRDYVIKSNDYLYKIAAKELGNGMRYKEILKCNPNITEKTTLSIGMHLKLPQR